MHFPLTHSEGAVISSTYMRAEHHSVTTVQHSTPPGAGTAIASSGNTDKTPPSSNGRQCNVSISPEVVEVTPRRFKKVAKKPKKVTFNCTQSEPMDITDDEETEQQGAELMHSFSLALSQLVVLTKEAPLRRTML